MTVLHAHSSSAGGHRRPPRIALPARAGARAALNLLYSATGDYPARMTDHAAAVRESAGATMGLIVLAYAAIEGLTQRHLTEMFGDSQ